MGKVETVDAQVVAVQAGEMEALKTGLGACYDQGMADAPVGTGGFTQADIDAAVAAAQLVDADALAAAKAECDAMLLDLNTKLEDVTGKKDADEKIIEGMKDSAEKLQAAVDLIHSLFPSISLK